MNFTTCVFTARRSSGGVLIMLKSLMPVIAIWSVRGMGVALKVRTSTFFFISFSFSLCFTPKRCSSSMTRRPRS